MTHAPTSGRSARRGGVYIAVLGVTLFVTLIGLSAMLLIDTERRTRTTIGDARIVRTDARSGLEIALMRVASDPSWRANHPSGVWTTTESLNATKWAFMLEYDGSTPADEPVEISLTVGARRNDSVRIFSMDAIVPLPGVGFGANAITNPDFESGYSPWYGFGATLNTDGTNPYSGAFSLGVTGRFFIGGGANLSVKDTALDNTNYAFSAWVRLPIGVTEQFVVKLTAIVGFTPTEDTVVTVGVVGGDWVQISGTLLCDWADGQTPSFVTLKFQTKDTKTDFWLDDVEFREVVVGGAMADVSPIVGTFRQRTLE